MKQKKALLLLSTILLHILSFGCSRAQPTTAGNDHTIDSMNNFSGEKILIVYLSRTNNTRAVAQMIQEQIGGIQVSLELENPYPQNYQAQVAQVVKENNEGYLPPLKTKIGNIDRFDVVFVGFPTWDMKIPPPIKSFLKEYDLNGKTVIPFNTNAGYGVGSGFQTVKELCPNSKVLDGFSTKGGIERDGILYVMEGEKKKQVKNGVITWLKKLQIK